MRKLFLFSLLLALFATSLAQQTNSSSALTKQDYLQKSKRQKTTAKILLGGGFVTFISGAATMGGKCSENVGSHILIGAGFTAMIISVPVFISASKNKRKAISMTLKSQLVPQFQETGFIHRAVPSLHLKISI